MLNEEKQVRQLLTNANQSLNFLRIVIDDFLYKRDKLSSETLKKVLAAQENYRMHKAILTNIEDLLSTRQYPIPIRLSSAIARSLRRRISAIIEEAIELDKKR